MDSFYNNHILSLSIGFNLRTSTLNLRLRNFRILNRPVSLLIFSDFGKPTQVFQILLNFIAQK
jgi:hypothetical protein